MKKIMLGLMAAALLCGCSGKPEGDPDVEEVQVNFEKDEEFGRLILSWEMPGDEFAEIQTAKPDGTVLYSYQTTSGYENVRDVLAYACQENDYYGPAVFILNVRSRDTEKLTRRYVSEEVNASEWFPEAREVSVDGRALQEFSWNRESQTMYVESLQDTLSNFSVYIFDDQADFYAVWYDSEGTQQNTETSLEGESLQVLESLIAGGKLVRAAVEDPDMQALDAPTPERMTAVYEGADMLERNWYEYEMSPEAKQKLIDAVLEFCRTGAWPQA